MASTGSFSAMAIFWTTPDQSISLRAGAIGIAVINATGNIGSALSPFMIGWLKISPVASIADSGLSLLC